MNIIFFSTYYHPEAMAASFRATENTRLWTAMGNQVTVFTGYPNYPKGRIFDGYTPKLLSVEEDNEVRILRSKMVAKKNTSIFNRLQNAFSYFFFGFINILFNKQKIGCNYDVVIGSSGVIFNALLAQRFAKRNKLPFVFEIRDITYEQLIATGKNKNSLSVKMMKKLELFLCRKAAKVVVVTNGFKYVLAEQSIPERKIEVITNGVDICAQKERKETKDPLILSYFGTLGISQNLVDALEYVEAIHEVIEKSEFLIIGGGAQREQVESTFSKLDYSRILPEMTMEQLEPYYDASLLSLIMLRKSESFKNTIPSKLFQVMGRGIAVLFIGQEGETAEIIRKYHAGITLTGDRSEDLSKLQSFFRQPDWKNQLLIMGENGRKAVHENFSRKKLAEKYIDVLKAAAN